jgi:hypothetical protein
MSLPKKAVAYTLLGTALTITTADAAALADDYTAPLHEFAGITAATAVGTGSVVDRATMSVRVPDTILDDQEYEARYSGMQSIYTRINRD